MILSYLLCIHAFLSLFKAIKNSLIQQRLVSETEAAGAAADGVDVNKEAIQTTEIKEVLKKEEGIEITEIFAKNENSHIYELRNGKEIKIDGVSTFEFDVIMK